MRIYKFVVHKIGKEKEFSNDKSENLIVVSLTYTQIS